MFSYDEIKASKVGVFNDINVILYQPHMGKLFLWILSHPDGAVGRRYGARAFP